MELKKVLTPWNWFKKEEEAKSVPVHVANYERGYPIERLHQEMTQVFDHFFRGFPFSPFSMQAKTSWEGLIHPQVDIAERTKDYTITVEVPGVEEKDIQLALADRTLTIRGEKHYEQEDHDQQFHRVERSYGSFQRVISLPDNANEQEVKATFKNGVLTIVVGKNAQALSSARTIAINN